MNRENHRVLVIAILAISFAQASLVSADVSKLEIGSPPIRNFSSKEYKGQPQVWDIVADSRGVMYFGTWDELLEFDGHRWRRTELEGASGVRSLAVDDNGLVYVGGVDELGYLAPDDKGEMTYVSLTNKLPEKDRNFDDIWTIHVTTHGVYYCGAKVTFRWHDQRFTKIPRAGVVPPKIGDSIYMYTDDGIFVLSSDGVLQLTNAPLSKEKYGKVLTGPFPGGEWILVNSEKLGFFLYPLKSPPSSSPEDYLVKFENEADEYITRNQFYEAILVGDNRVAIATRRGGVLVLNAKGELLQIINERRGLGSDIVFDLYEDRFQNLWMGTNSGISYVSISSPLTLFGKNAGLDSMAHGITRHQGEMYTGTFASGAHRLPPYELALEDDIHSFEALKGDLEVYGLDFVAVGRTLLVASQTIRRIDEGRVESIEGTPTCYVLHKSKRFPGCIFAGIAMISETNLALLEFSVTNPGDEDEKVEFVYKGGISGVDGVVRKIEEDKDGNLWLCTQQSGLMHLRFKSDDVNDFEIQKYGTEDGLPTLDWNIVHLEGDTVLVATAKGVYKAVPAEDGGKNPLRFVPEPAINQGLGGIKLDVESIAKYAENTWLVQPYNTYGFLYRDENGKYRSDSRPFRSVQVVDSAKHIDSDGVLWLVSEYGVYRYDPHHKKDYETPYATLIRKVTTNLGNDLFKGTHYDPNSRSGDTYARTILDQPVDTVPVLTYEENGVKFEYTALFFEEEENTRYQVMLSGFDTKWSDWQESTIKEYTNIPEGKYTFKVRAKNVYDTVSRTATYQFNVEPPWYRTLWAYIGFALVLIGLLYAGAQLRTRRLRAAKKRLEGIVKERTAEVVTQRDEIAHQKDQIEEARNALWGEMEIAKKIQTVLLPEDPRIPGFEITGYMQTADEVGGDYYDVINVEDRNWIIIGDVSGHGVPAGLVMMMVQTAINQVLLGRANESPETILTRVNRNIYRNIDKLGDSKYMTLTLFSFEPNGVIYFSGLHQDIFIYRKKTGQVDAIETQGMWLGIMDEIEGMNSVDELHMEPGDAMLLFTDGIVEATDENGEHFQEEQLKTIFEKHGNLATSEIRDKILKSLDGYKTDDDITMLLVKRNCE